MKARPRWFSGGASFVAVYVLLLVTLLTAPVGRIHSKRGYLNDFNRPAARQVAVDAVVNVVLFVPLGWSLQRALRGRGWRIGAGEAVITVVFIGAGFSLAIETLQHLLPTRYSSIIDVAFNSVGTAIGSIANHYLD